MATPIPSTDPSTSVSDKWNNIPVLTSSNFFDWKLRLETALGARRLKKFILSDLPLPTDPIELETHQVNDARALEAIQSTIDPGNFQVISQSSTARSAYLAILKHHDDSGGISTAHLFSELATLRLTSNGSLADHLLKFRQLHNELLGNLRSTPDLSISEPFIAILLLKSLPAEFSPMVQTTLSQFESIKLDHIYTLLQMETKRSTESSSTDTALSATSKPNPSKFKKREWKVRDDVKCLMGHPGHTDEFCRAKIRNDLEECKKQLADLRKEKKPEVAKAAIESSTSLNDQVHPSYYDTAFTA